MDLSFWFLFGHGSRSRARSFLGYQIFGRGGLYVTDFFVRFMFAIIFNLLFLLAEYWNTRGRDVFVEEHCQVLLMYSVLEE